MNSGHWTEKSPRREMNWRWLIRSRVPGVENLRSAPERRRPWPLQRSHQTEANRERKDE
jgi:hypothetical protein